MLKVFDANDGKLLFRQRLEYAEAEVNRSLSFDDSTETEVYDSTVLRPHPSRKIFMTSSNLYVKIYDSRTGALLQTVVQPLIRVDLQGKQHMTHGKTVESAGWSKDGKTLYVFSANHTSVSLWQLIQ